MNKPKNVAASKTHTHKGKKFAAFDIDGTLFRSGLSREVIYELVRMGAVPEHVLKNVADKETAWKKRTHGSAFAEFDQAMIDGFDEQLPRLKIAYFDLAAEQVIAAHKDNVYVYTRNLVRTLKEQDYFLIAVSGSQQEIVGPFAEHYGFDTWVGKRFERGGEYFTGHARKTHDKKGKHLQKLIDKHDLTLAGSIAVGDSGGDIEMLSMVEQPIAFNPESNLFEQARAKGWKIVLERKNMIYELEQKGAAYELHAANSH